MATRKNLFKQRKLVVVEWEDSYGCSSGWEIIERPSGKSYMCYTAGWVVEDNENILTVYPHIAPEDRDIGLQEQGCGDMTIPKSAIKKLTEIN